GLNVISVYVDDMLVAFTNDKEKEYVLATLKEKFGSITCNFGKEFEYLGIRIKYDDNGYLTMSMNNYVEDVTKGISDTRISPATKNIFEMSSGNTLSEKERKRFRSELMRIFYLSKKLRPDI